MDRDTLVDRDGWLYILSEVSSYHEPAIYKSWYATGIKTHGFVRDYGVERLGQQMTYDKFRGDWFGADKMHYAMLQGRDTRPAFWESIPLPCPKVRTGLETRYRDGHWEKLLKSGWTWV